MSFGSYLCVQGSGDRSEFGNAQTRMKINLAKNIRHHVIDENLTKLIRSRKKLR